MRCELRQDEELLDGSRLIREEAAKSSQNASR